jgi:hypothetical protein
MNGAYALEFIRTQACGGFLFGLLSFFFRSSFSRLTLFPCNSFGNLSSVFFMTPLFALAEHVISGFIFLALTQRVDALHRMIWHDMALADDTQPFSTIGSYVDRTRPRVGNEDF